MTVVVHASEFHLHEPSINRPPNASIVARGRPAVVSKRDSGRVKASARERVHPLVCEMVREQERQLGRRMPAYAAVGEWIGVKATWVRRLIGRQDVPVSGDRLLMIVAAYRAHCERVESRAAESRAATARRWEEIDALLGGLGEPDRRGPGLDPESAREGGSAVRGAETRPGWRA